MKNASHIGKKAEWLFREIRSYISPANWQSYHRLKNETFIQPSHIGKKLALFDFHSIAIDNVGGRYLYHIVQDFIALGYTPCYRNNFRFISNIETKGFKKHLLSLEHIFYNHEEELKQHGTPDVYLSDRLLSLENSSCPHKVYVDYALKKATDEEVPLTFGPSPVLLRDNLFTPSTYNDSPRLNRIFFSGRTRAKEYDRDLLMKNYGMINRIQMLQVASDYPHADKLIPLEQLPDDEWNKPHDILLVSNDHCRIPSSQWMNIMAQSDFFLACPGSEMPLCHNVIESLAAGAIPILQYPQYLKPGLEHGVNCLAFKNKEELNHCIKKALNMTQEEINHMRSSVFAFYHAHYQPGKLAEKLLKKDVTTLVMNDYRIRIIR